MTTTLPVQLGKCYRAGSDSRDLSCLLTRSEYSWVREFSGQPPISAIHCRTITGHRRLHQTIQLSFFLLLVCLAPLLAQPNPGVAHSIPGVQDRGQPYYAGTADLAVSLIGTPQGNILINSDFPEDVPTIRKSIEQLGFKYSDTKILLISHAQGDHNAGIGLMQKETGARLMVMDGDVPEVQSTAPGLPGAHVDRVPHDGNTVELGGSILTARLTPGDTTIHAVRRARLALESVHSICIGHQLAFYGGTL
jgi:hypothetical protein